MTPMISSDPTLLKGWLDQIKTDEATAGIALLGTNGEAYKESLTEWSILVVAKEETGAAALFGRCKGILTLSSALIAQDISMPGRYRHVALLENFVPIELSVMHLDQVQPRNKPWNVIHDQDKGLETALTPIENGGASEKVKERYLQLVEGFWHPLMQCLVALKHDETWRAMALLDAMRHQVLELAGLRNGLEMAGFRDADRLPEMLLMHLRHTLPVSASATAIKRSVKTAFTLFFGEAAALDTRFGLKTGQEMEGKLQPFVELHS